MNILQFNGGHSFSMKDGPNDLINHSSSSNIVALVPPRFSTVKPKIIVKVGETVKIGQVLFFSKQNTEIKFTSPAFGIIYNICYGKKRKLKAIEIKKLKLTHKSFIIFEKENVEKLSSIDILNNLINSGLWSKFKTFPGFNYISNKDVLSEKKSVLFISLFSTEPHMADIQLLLSKKNYMKLFLYGLRVCSKIFKKIYIFNNKNEFPVKISEFSNNLNNIYLYSIENRYPAENPGLQCFLTNSIGIDILNIYSKVFTLIEIGHLFVKGQVLQERYISISGNGINKKNNMLVNTGIPIKTLLRNIMHIEYNRCRIISGGILTGKKILFSDYLSDEDLSLQILEEDKKRTFFSFFRLGINELTLLKTWVAGFFPKSNYDISTSNNGEERACIQCGYCFEVCPVQLMPSLIIKSAIINDIEKMEYLSIHECIECELCTFICPSKIELGQHIKNGKDFIKKEG